eukprot:TRINITY_DN2954_c0_g1_i4.p5 TRINITY_DN2954_c0_g1~~TRINITY_DN2954_c0_g1_i4.p5  ORF type:complete len:163 (-),score=0.91 TRINITY_DN2954_c0_g1_i4:1215-1703(-)
MLTTLEYPKNQNESLSLQTITIPVCMQIQSKQPITEYNACIQTNIRTLLLSCKNPYTNECSQRKYVTYVKDAVKKYRNMYDSFLLQEPTIDIKQTILIDFNNKVDLFTLRQLNINLVEQQLPFNDFIAAQILVWRSDENYITACKNVLNVCQNSNIVQQSQI